ncbi:MAG: hypothetical protein ACHQEA_06055 [Gaiellales bacterium]
MCSLQVKLEPDEPPVALGAWFGAPAVSERVDEVEAAAAGAVGRRVEHRSGEARALAEDDEEAIPRAIAEVASELGNTPAVARASYIHPAILSGCEDGELPVDDLREALGESGGRLTEELVIVFLRDRG